MLSLPGLDVLPVLCVGCPFGYLPRHTAPSAIWAEPGSMLLGRIALGGPVSFLLDGHASSCVRTSRHISEHQAMGPRSVQVQELPQRM